MATKRVLVTGAEGVIGTAVRELLDERFEVRSLTLEPAPFPSHVADIADLAAIEPAFAGIDAVVHLAASSPVDSSWEAVLHSNLIGTYNVFEAARRAGVGTVVFASSNHAIGMYELEGAPELYDLDDARVYDHTIEVRPDSLYGVSKVYGEALGRFYADFHGLRVFCLRIGAVRAGDEPTSDEALSTAPAMLNLKTREERRKRMRAVWLSRRDCVQLIERCLDADHIRWAIVYGVSNNPRRFWDIEHARDLLGYDPRDAAPE